MGGFHPWRELRALDDVRVHHVDLPEGTLGTSDGASQIWLDRDMLQTERRCTLTHELEHIERGHVGGCSERDEEDVRQASARRLISLDALIAAVAWGRSLAEVAEELWVDEDTLTTRLRHLHPAERGAMARAASMREESA